MTRMITQADITALAPAVFAATVKRIERRADGICEFEFALPESSFFAPDAGSNIEIAVRDKNGAVKANHYSLVNAPGEGHVYRIAVQEEANGSGGSVHMHHVPKVGDTVYVSAPKNEFPLTLDAPHSLLIAGGIGITPIYSMAQALASKQCAFELHYTARSRSKFAFAAELAAYKTTFYAGDEGEKLDLDAVIKQATPATHIYVCGPKGLIEAVIAKAEQLGIQRSHVHFELFGAAATDQIANKPIEVTLKKSGKTVHVAPDISILDAVLAQGVEAAYGCKRGECGACATPVLAGIPEHRDVVLSREDKEAGTTMCICVSRAKGDMLVLDL